MRKHFPRTLAVPSVAVARARYQVAREAGHGPDCAMMFARGVSRQQLPASLSPLEHCVCALRRKIVSRSPVGWRRLPAVLLTPAERYERTRRYG